VFYMPVALLVMHRMGIRGGRLAGHFAAMAMLVMAWFAPVVLAPPIERGAFADATGRVAADLARFKPLPRRSSLRCATRTWTSRWQSARPMREPFRAAPGSAGYAWCGSP